MSGIYIHVPFCHRKCSYCDFYSVGKSRLTNDFSSLVVKELELRKKFLPESKVETIYFGGGTPSLLNAGQIKQIIDGITNSYVISENPEITLEVNPDDLSLALLQEYRQIGINRISIGVQSFNDSELSFLGRRHNATKAIESVELIHRAGFENISLDLIYGIPQSSLQAWNESLKMAFKLDIQHLSCYHLTYEKSTPLTRKLEKGNFLAIDEDLSYSQFEVLRSVAADNNFVHYEVSNLAKDGFYSRHNSAYWLGIPYLGLGPSAHSYNMVQRQWNPSSLEAWSNALKQEIVNAESESIDTKTRFNEMLLTRLRTIWGVRLDEVECDFGKFYLDHLVKSVQKHVDNGNLTKFNQTILIPAERYFVSDSIVSDLFML